MYESPTSGLNITSDGLYQDIDRHMNAHEHTYELPTVTTADNSKSLYQDLVKREDEQEHLYEVGGGNVPSVPQRSIAPSSDNSDEAYMNTRLVKN